MREKAVSVSAAKRLPEIERGRRDRGHAAQPVDRKQTVVSMYHRLSYATGAHALSPRSATRKHL